MKISKNFRGFPPTDINNGDVFENCQLAQLFPHTEICVDVTGLTFRGCNLVNCILPSDAIIEDCSHVGKHKSRCSNKHPRWMEKGLPECGENCEHVIRTEEITTGGEVIETIYHYADKAV